MQEFADKYLFNQTVGRLVTIFIGIAVIWSVIHIYRRNFSSRIKDTETRYKTRKLVSFAGYFIIILLISVVYSDKLGGLTVALGVAGAGIAFALQEVIASIAGWLVVSFGGYYKIGDRVQLGGIKGDVIDIGVIRTTLMETGQWVDGDLYNGRIVRIANSFVFKEPVFNYSGDFPFLWDEIKLPVQFDSNHVKAKELFRSIAVELAGDLTESSQAIWRSMVSKYMVEDAQTAPMVTIFINDNWVEYTIRYVVDYKKRRITKDTLFSKILTAVSQTNGEIKFASATFQLVGAPDMNINLKSQNTDV